MYLTALKLVRRAVAAMIREQCAEIMLETEVTNAVALKLYEKLGFMKDIRMHKYYLNGVDAFRLVLPVQCVAERCADDEEELLADVDENNMYI
mgnify:CR=1 FL=1